MSGTGYYSTHPTERIAEINCRDNEVHRAAFRRDSRMSEEVTEQDPGHDIVPQPPGSTGEPRTRAQRSRRRKLRTVLVMAVLGVGLSLGAFSFYPRGSAGVPTPLFSRLGISTTFPIALVGLNIIQVSPSVAELKISIELLARTPSPPAGAQPASIVVAPALGTSFRNCPPPFCKTLPGAPPASLWVVPLTFQTAANFTGKATAVFYVKAASFGLAVNGTTASAAIPEVLYNGPGKPMLLVAYHIPDAASYDWSSFPTAAVNSSVATWQESFASGDTPGRAAIGIRPAGQSSRDYKTFLAGALLGLGGGAIIAAFQEGLDATAD
jgi:hypothetical protein